MSATSFKMDRDRWNQLDFMNQMGNIGSEVGRTLSAKRRGADFWPALTRALDLFDATLEPLIAVKSHRSKELMRAKYAFLEAVMVRDDPGIEAYFMHFATAARLRRPTPDALRLTPEGL